MKRSKLLPSALALGLALAATGCSKLREVSACRGVAREVNAAVDEIEALSQKKPVDEPRIAKRYAALAKALAPRSVGETPLAIAVRDYIAILQGTEAALRSHAEATNTPYGKAVESRRELDRLVKREHSAALRIEAECGN
jgi:hypothetical protein